MKLQLRDIRKKSHVSQEDLAKKVGVSSRAIGAWERGENFPSAEQIWNCSVALGSTPNDLMGWYATHPRENITQLIDPEHAELVDCYDQCTKDRKDSLMRQARDAALLSREFPERAVAAAATAWIERTSS